MSIEVPETVLRYCVSKGSVAIDGVSLTINDVGQGEIWITAIPHTAEATTLGLKQRGTMVNIETDLIGKYVERLLLAGPQGGEPQIDVDFLKRTRLL